MLASTFLSRPHNQPTWSRAYAIKELRCAWVQTGFLLIPVSSVGSAVLRIRRPSIQLFVKAKKHLTTQEQKKVKGISLRVI